MSSTMGNAESIETTVEVYGEPCKVIVFKLQNGDWRAEGRYKEHHIRRDGRNFEAAHDKWERAARMAVDS